MAIRRKKDIFDTGNLSGVISSTTITAGSLLYRDTSNALLKEATSSVGITTNLIGVSAASATSSDTAVDFIPLVPNPGQLWEVDCTNNTAADQLYKAQAMTDARTVANTSSHIATTLGVFIPVAIVGAAADKKLMGYFVTAGQVTA